VIFIAAMVRLQRLAFALPASCLALACGTSIQYSPMNNPPHAMQPRPPEAVQVFMESRPKEDFVEVGLFEAQARASGLAADDRAEVLAKMRERAGEMGCDGLIIAGSDDKVEGYVSHGEGSTTTYPGYRASCIVFTGAPAPAAPPPVAPAAPAGS
jgi:hypothetical protein